jgi:hypothetical protein
MVERGYWACGYIEVLTLELVEGCDCGVSEEKADAADTPDKSADEGVLGLAARRASKREGTISGGGATF